MQINTIQLKTYYQYNLTEKFQLTDICCRERKYGDDSCFTASNEAK